MLNIFNTASNNEFNTGIVLFAALFFFFMQLFANKKMLNQSRAFFYIVLTVYY